MAGQNKDSTDILKEKALDLFFLENHNSQVIKILENVITGNTIHFKNKIFNIIYAGAVCEKGNYKYAKQLINEIDITKLNTQETTTYYYLILGLINFRNEMFAESYIHLLNAIRQTDNDRVLGLGYRILARITNNYGNYSESIVWLDKSNIHFKNAKLDKSISINYKILGRCYVLINDRKKAMQYFLKAAQGIKKANDTLEIFYVYVNLTDIYLNTRQFKLAHRYIDSCLQIYNKYHEPKLLGQILINKGELALAQNNFNIAIEDFHKSLNLYKTTINTRAEIVLLTDLALAYRKKNDYNKSLNMGLQAFNKAIRKNRKEQAKKAAYQLVKSYTLKGILDSALFFQKIIIKLYDSIYNDNLIKNKTFFEIKTEIAQKEKEIILSKAKIEKVKLSRLYLSIGSILILLSLVFVYILFLKKKKAYNVLYQKSIEGVKQEKKNNECRISLARKHPDIDKQGKLYNDLIEIIEHKKVHHNKGLTLDELAKNLSTNREYLSQIINEQYGRFNDFINHYRINDTVEILSDAENKKSRYSLKVIAGEVGFKSLSTFITAFKKETGLTPSKFRDSRN